MARYKHLDTTPRLLAVDLERQLLPGTFEHALNHLIDHELDLSPFDVRFRNDSSGAPAYPPGVLLKVVLFAYAQGIIGSRPIARACTEHVTFIALSDDSQPHITTIAYFVSTLGTDIATVCGGVVKSAVTAEIDAHRIRRIECLQRGTSAEHTLLIPTVEQCAASRTADICSRPMPDTTATKISPNSIAAVSRP